MIVKANDFDASVISEIETLPQPKGNRGRTRKPLYKNVVCAFDIETTYIPEINNSVMYIWQFQIGHDYTIIGRTWTELQDLMHRISDELKVAEHLVVYVHNLSYEFQYLSGIYNFTPEEVFALESRKILKCSMLNHFEFRCSYLQSNMSLDKFTEKMDVEHKKLSGSLDYNKRRFWFTPLSDEELAYCINDVIGLVEAIEIEMQKDGDNLYTIPMTSTGYVRRDFKNVLRPLRLPEHFTKLKAEIYDLCREAFRGGNTHANRHFAGMLLENVHSADRSSSYPEVQCNHEYPVTEFRPVEPVPDMDGLLKMITQRKKAVLMRLQLVNPRLREISWGCPYLSYDKSRNCKNPVLDNGRILSADYCEVTFTDIDLRIFLDEYECDDIIPVTVAYSTYGKLPEVMIKLICDYYVKKTELKDVDGEEYFYMKSKNKLNGIYGMTAQDPCKIQIVYQNGEYVKAEPRDSKPFIPYFWGVWCTAWARFELEEGIKLAHKEGAFFVYCDTDSVKYLGEIDWTEYNAMKEEASKQSGAFATDPKGVTHYMGVYEIEKTCIRFITYGSKKYAYTVEKNGKESPVIITVAGVPKKKGAEELENAGGIEAFKPPFIFNAGKLESVYNDIPEPFIIKINDKNVVVTKNVALKPTTYELGMTAEYRELLEDRIIYNKAMDILKVNVLC